MRGTVFEESFWVPAMRARFGPRLMFAGTEQKTFVSGFISATPDGLLGGCEPDSIAPGSGTEVTVECKTADPRTNLSEAKAENVYQTHIQMGLIRELTLYQPTHSILSYTDASFWSEVKEFVIEFNPKIYASGKARAAEIMTATNAAELKPEGWIAGGGECEYCPFTGACGVERRSVPAEGGVAGPQFIAEATDLALAIKRLKVSIKSDETASRDLQEDLKNRLRARGIRKIPKVLSWASVKGSPSYDNKALREAAQAAGIDIEQFSTIGEPMDRLTILLKEQDLSSASADDGQQAA